MAISTSLLALLLLALSGGPATAWAEASLPDVSTEAPVSHDAPVDAEETDGEEDGVHAFRAVRVVGAVSSLEGGEAEVISVYRVEDSPPPER